MKIRRCIQCFIIAGVAIVLTNTSIIAEENSAQTSGATSAPIISFRSYPDHVFVATEYIQGMQKGAHNLLIWKDPAVDLSKYSSVKVTDFGGRLLPQQEAFPYDQFIILFNSTFRSSLKLSQTNAPNALLVEGTVVECNPGSSHLRFWLSFGAGKASAAVVCEVYEPGKSQPCMRIYTRDYAAGGNYASDESVTMLNNIMSQVATRLADTLNKTLATK